MATHHLTIPLDDFCYLSRDGTLLEITDPALILPGDTVFIHIVEGRFYYEFTVLHVLWDLIPLPPTIPPHPPFYRFLHLTNKVFHPANESP